MNFRKHSTLMVGLGTALLLLIAAVYFLISNRSTYMASQDALTSAKNRLISLNNRNPYPSAEHVAMTETQLSVIKTNYEEMTGMLRDAQITPEKIEPAQFALILEGAVRRIRERAQAEGVELPTDPGLGFKDYAAGKLPSNDPAVIERLVVQIKALEDIISLLIGAKVTSIDALQRDQFEVGAVQPDADAEPDPRRARSQFGREQSGEPRAVQGGVPPAPASELYSTERLTVEFTARESAVWEALNRLGSSKVLYVLVDLSLNTTAAEIGKPVDLKAKLSAMHAAARGNSPGSTSSGIPSLDSLSREERVVGGREPIKVRMVVDMYRFKEIAAGEGAP